MRRRLMSFACAMAAASCSTSAPDIRSVHVSERDSAGVSIVEITGAVADLPQWELSAAPVVEISGSAPPLLGSVGEVEFLSDGRLLVEDNQTHELRIFSFSGGYELVGGAGEGPGEFRNLTELTVAAGDTFYAFDRRLLRLTVFDPGGRLVSTTAVAREDGGPVSIPIDMWAFDSGHLVLHRLGPYDTTNAAPQPRRDQRDAVVTELDGTGRPLGRSLRFQGSYSIDFEMGDASAPFGNQPTIAVAGGQLLYTSAIDYELTLMDREFHPRRIVRWSGWRRPLDEATLAFVRDSFDTGLSELKAARPDLAKSLLDGSFSPNTLPDTLPALGPVFLSDDGRMWVSRFGPFTERWREESAWHVLAPNGHPEARVLLPAGSRLAAVRDSVVALIVRDALEVESVHVYTIRSDSGRAR